MHWHIFGTFFLQLLTNFSKGCCVGDILGRAVEFDNIEKVKQKYPQGVINFAHRDANCKWTYYCYTDDTEMLLAVASSLVQHKTCDAEHVCDSIVKFFVQGGCGYV